MTQYVIDLEWIRDRSGYELLDPLDTTPSLGRNGVRRGSVIRRLYGQEVTYRPLALHDRLFVNFANEVRDPQTLLSFIRRFGPVTWAGRAKRDFFQTTFKNKKDQERAAEMLGDNVESCVEAAQQFWRILDHNKRQPKSIGKVLAPFFRSIELEPTLDLDPQKGILLRLKPKDLLDGMKLLLVQDLTSGLQVKACLKCRQWFEVGAGKGRRKDAKFCCDEHRILYNSENR